METIRNKARRLISPNLDNPDDRRMTGPIRYSDKKEIYNLPGAAEISYEIESDDEEDNLKNINQVDVANINLNNKKFDIIAPPTSQVKEVNVINLLDSFNKIKEEEEKQVKTNVSNNSKKFKLPIPRGVKSTVKVNPNAMKPPVGNTLPKVAKASPLSKITEKDETYLAPTDPFDFSARMEDIDEGSREASLSNRQKSSVEKTERLNFSNNDGFDDVNSMDFQEFSFEPPISDQKRSSGGRMRQSNSNTNLSTEPIPGYTQR